MTATSGAENGVSRREFMVGTSDAVVGGGALASAPAKAVRGNEICRMDAVSLAEKIRSKELSLTEVTEAVLARMDKLNRSSAPFARRRRRWRGNRRKAVEAEIMAGRA